MSAPMFGAIAAACAGLAVMVKDLPPYVTSALGAAFAFALLEAADEFIPYPIVAVPHAAVACILFAAPVKAAAETAQGVLGGHVAAAGVAVALLKVKLPAAAAFALKTIAVALAIGVQKALGTVHPPAIGIAFVWATSGQDDPMKLVGPLIGCCVLIAAQQGWLQLTVTEKKKKRS